ncbi:MAG TPA: hypothetical protein VK469_02600, partial [Candidatus Kapabacteria bacterium]|nr:hypothetical protein [Candidatus Kapabacteria bacterium]
MPKWVLVFTIMVFMLPIFTVVLTPVDTFVLETTAERSNFEKTSSYNDVMDFLFEAQKRSDKINIIRFATTTEGRMIPLVIISNEGIKSP